MNSYYVSKNKIPCKIANVSLHYKGVLMPISDGEQFTNFGENYSTGKRKAARAIKRTIKIADKLRGSVISEWPLIAGLVSPGQYAIEVIKIKTPASDLIK